MKKAYSIFTLLFVIFSLSMCKKNDAPAPPPDNYVSSDSGLLVWSPAFPTANDNITITVDPSEGNKGLAGYVGDVYAYTGVITDKSSSATDWKYVTSSSFNTPDPATKATYVGEGKFQFKLTPATFYKVPEGEKILKIAILFKNGSGTLVAKNSDGSDMYIPVYEAGQLAVKFTTPPSEPTFVQAPVVGAKIIGDELSVSGIASQKANLTISLNDVSFATASNATSVLGKVKLTTGGTQTVKINANNGQAEQSFSFVVAGNVETAALPSNAKDGVTFTNNGASAIFNLYAPGKKFVYVIGDFSDWKADVKYLAKRTPDGNNWWVQIDGLDPAKEYAYQYMVDGDLQIADPYSEKILDPDNDKYIDPSTYPNLKAYPTGKTKGIVSVIQGNAPQYTWQVANFTRPQKQNLVIYELLMRDFIAAHNYKTLEDTLSYLSRLGVNAIELMPVNEFEGNSSWGYNPDFYFAPDKYYGTKNELKTLIDKCHQKGIAVVLDLVLNHSYGQSPMVQLYFENGKPAASSPWFNQVATHPYSVGYDFNHESQATKYFSKNVMKFWMQEYKVDGFRFDLSKGFTQKNTGSDVDAWSQYDASRIAIWNDYNNYMKSIDNNNFYVILEHFAEDREEKELSASGMMLWNNLNYNMNQSTMGYMDGSDFSRGFYTTHGFAEANNLVSYMESHDEERLMFKNLQYGNSYGSYSIKDLATALNRQKMAAAFLFSIPGPKMIWQFGELGYDKSIDENGRTGEKPILWNYRTEPNRAALYNVFAKMIALKKNNAVFATTNFQYDLGGTIKWIKLMSGSANVVVVGNFDVVNQTANIAFPSVGTWYDALNNNTTISITGNYNATLAPGEFHVFSSNVLN